MRRLVEITCFLGLSAAVHAAIIGQWAPPGGTAGQGGGGESRATLQAAPDNIAAMIDRWTDPPQIADIAPLVEPMSDTGPPPLTAETSATSAPRPPDLSVSMRDERPIVQAPVPAMAITSDAPAGFAQPAPQADSEVALSLPDASMTRQSPGIFAPQEASDPFIDTSSPPASSLAVTTSRRPAIRPDRTPPQVVTTSPPASARIAAGQGAAVVAGDAAASADQAPGLGDGAHDALMAQWGGRILARIERSRPRVAGEGRVTVALEVAPDGQLAGLSVAQSSGNGAVDQAALTAVQRAGRLPAAPDGLTDASYAFALPIRFE